MHQCVLGFECWLISQGLQEWPVKVERDTEKRGRSKDDKTGIASKELL